MTTMANNMHHSENLLEGPFPDAQATFRNELRTKCEPALIELAKY